MRSGIFWIANLLLAVLCIAGPQPASAGTGPRIAAPCTLAWDSQPNRNPAGYAVYYGQTGSGTTNRLNVGAAQVATIYNLVAATNYFFYAVSYDTNGIESAPSNLISYTPSALTLRMLNLPDGTMRVQFFAATGAVCRIEHAPTTRPPQWTSLGNAIADSNGRGFLDDPPQNRPPARFYRGVLP